MARSITIGIVASALWLAALAAHAAGLGRLTVLSPLGQPLLAEVEIVSLQPGEEDGLSARLAPAEAFNAAGIEISPALLGVRIDITRRNNRPVLRLTTKQPVSDPFLDMLIELQWPTGRLVREYTFLLDPPDYRARSAAIAAAPPPPAAPAQALPTPQAESAPQTQAAPQPQAESQPQPEAQAQAVPVPVPVPATPQESPAPAEQKPAAEEKPSAGEEKPAAIEEKPIAPGAEAKQPAKEEPAKASTHEVKKGDTLGAIARANLAPGVTLNQMLIAIFRANQEAFIRGNVNLVRTGKILNIPSAETIATVDRDEANRLVKEQHAQFMEYRSRLAAVPSSVEGGPEREAAGRIEPKPEATPPAAPGDQVRLSKAEPGKPAAPASRAAREDDAAARERALQEAQSRSADLEKNVADLQKLLDLKNQQLAELERKAAAKPPAAAPQAPAPAKPAAQAPQPAAPSASPPVQSAPAQPAPAPQAPGPQAQAPQAVPPPAPAAKPAVPPPPAEKKAEVPKPRPKAAPPPPPEPSLLDELLDNPLYLAALGAVVLLLVGYAFWSWRRKKAAHAKFQDSVLGAAAAGGGAAALHEPTASTVVSQAPVSQAPAGMEPEEVDPIAEADVYMAYGRDAQAEEILKEALQKDSSRTAVHGKLLEIYANRKDAKTFEQTALKLKGLTHGAGPEWEKAAALGRSIDPQNSVYGDVAPAPAAGAATPAAAPMLDFDLGGSSQGGPAAPDISLDEAKEPTASNVDIELGATNTLKIEKQAPDETLATETTKSAGGLDFDLDLGATEAAPAAKAEEASGGGLDFNLDLDDKKGGAPQPPPQPVAPAPLDLGEISLDLGGPSEETATATQAAGDPKWQEVATKLDLAKAYEEMGDKDGARELLNEVMKDGDTAQKGQAEQILAKLG